MQPDASSGCHRPPRYRDANAIESSECPRRRHGQVHCGVLAYLADKALTFAGGSVFGGAVTVEMKINYLRPATENDRLLAVTELVDSGKTLAVCRCDVFTAQAIRRSLCATAQGTIRKAA